MDDAKIKSLQPKIKLREVKALQMSTESIRQGPTKKRNNESESESESESEVETKNSSATSQQKQQNDREQKKIKQIEDFFKKKEREEQRKRRLKEKREMKQKQKQDSIYKDGSHTKSIGGLSSKNHNPEQQQQKNQEEKSYQKSGKQVQKENDKTKEEKEEKSQLKELLEEAEKNCSKGKDLNSKQQEGGVLNNNEQSLKQQQQLQDNQQIVGIKRKRGRIPNKDKQLYNDIKERDKKAAILSQEMKSCQKNILVKNGKKAFQLLESVKVTPNQQIQETSQQQEVKQKQQQEQQQQSLQQQQQSPQKMISNQKQQELEAKRKREEEEMKDLLKQPHWYQQYAQKFLFNEESQKSKEPVSSRSVNTSFGSIINSNTKEGGGKWKNKQQDIFIENEQLSEINDLFIATQQAQQLLLEQSLKQQNQNFIQGVSNSLNENQSRENYYGSIMKQVQQIISDPSDLRNRTHCMVQTKGQLKASLMKINEQMAHTEQALREHQNLQNIQNELSLFCGMNFNKIENLE